MAIKCPECSFVNFETRETCTKCGAPLPRDDSDEWSASLDELSSDTAPPRAAPSGERSGPTTMEGSLPTHPETPAPHSDAPQVATQQDLSFELSGDYPEPTFDGAPVDPNAPPPMIEDAGAEDAAMESVFADREALPGPEDTMTLDESAEWTGSSEVDIIGATPSPFMTPPAVRRVLAFCIDAVILWALTLVFLLAALVVGDVAVGADAQRTFAAVWLPVDGLGFLLGIVYFTWFWGAAGQTPGKMATSLVVVGADGGPISFGTAALRAVSYWISALPLMAGFLLGLVSKDRRALHDRIAGTRVIART